MINFLKEANVNDETLIKIIKHNPEAELFNLSCNSKNVIKIINYMRQLGITDVDELLIYRIDVFTLAFEQFVKKISKFNIPELVNLINEDYTNIDIINNYYL